MQKIGVIFALVLCASIVLCQKQQDNIVPLDEGSIKISNATVPENGRVSFSSNKSSTNPCKLGICVPYYQCVNGSVNTDGEGLFDSRAKRDTSHASDNEYPCPNVLDVCCILHVEEPTIPPNTESSVGCGIRNLDVSGHSLVGINDNQAQFAEFPWSVAILKQIDESSGQKLNVYACGGSLIHPGVVLTSANCINNKDPVALKVRAGEWDTQTKDEVLPHQDRQVLGYVIHPNYNQANLINDIALLFLTQPLNVAKNVNTVCLPNQGEKFDGQRCFASGWGKDKKGKYQTILKRVELPIVSREKCISDLRKTRLGQYFQLHHSFICAGGEPGRDTCKGDGGSALVCQVSNEHYVQVGIVSWGISCGDEKPAAYVNVPLFRDWIDEQMKLANLNTSAYSP